MAKHLRIITEDKRLEGVKKSKVEDGQVYGGKDASVQTNDPATVELTKKHKVEKHADRVGNDSDVYAGGKQKPALDDARNKRMKPDEKMYEEAEELEEISKEKVGKYVSKALDTGNEKSISNLASRGGYELGKSDDFGAGEKYDAKAVQRSKGVKTAVKKLTGKAKVPATNEEVELDEKNTYRTALTYDKDDKETGGITVRSNRQALKLVNKLIDKADRHKVRLFKGDNPTDKSQGRVTKSKLVKEESEQVEEAEKWIQKAIKKPGALHKQLGVPSEKKIPSKKLAAAAEKGGKLGKRARLAQTLKKLHKESADCNKSQAGTHCPTHGLNDCSGMTGKSKYLLLDKKGMNEATLDEVITKKTSVSDMISDFVHSKDPKFAGKSKEERKKMALGAYYKMHPEKSKVQEDAAEPMIGESGKKKKVRKESGPDTPIKPSGDIPSKTMNLKADTGYNI